MKLQTLTYQISSKNYLQSAARKSLQYSAATYFCATVQRKSIIFLFAEEAVIYNIFLTIKY